MTLFEHLNVKCLALIKSEDINLKLAAFCPLKAMQCQMEGYPIQGQALAVALASSFVA